MEKMYCVISHTHWDREWYKPFEHFRIHLTDLINNLLDIMKEYPNYIFHLDAQTVVLDDFLVIYPEKRAELEKWIKSGNIIVGPWYLQNDFYLTSGESTVRNLIEGARMANAFGACGKAGYAADQFGVMSQVPQILSDFGIDNFVFARGASFYHFDENGKAIIDEKKSEFIWEGADGTKLLAVNMPFWYNNAQRFSENIPIAKKLLEVVNKCFDGVATTPYLLLMNGVDHLEAQENLLPILEKLNKEDINGEVRQIKLSDYIELVKKYIQENDVSLRTHKGELRCGGDWSVLQGTLSSRSYLKTLNVLAQNQLENRLEPLYSMLEMAGCKGVYPRNYMRHLWRKLMQNHPHDSICGCSRDEIHAHMEDRYQKQLEITNVLTDRAMVEFAQHNAVATAYPDAYSLVAINTIGEAQNGVIEAELIFPEKDNVEGFSIYDSEGKEVEYALISRKKGVMNVFSPINLPGILDVQRCRVYISVPETAPFSIQGYSVRKAEKCSEAIKLVESDLPTFENEFLKVEVTSEGVVNVTDKDSGRVLRDCLYFEERGDRGHSYLFSSTSGDIIYSRGIKPEITMLENNGFVKKCKISWVLTVPEKYDFERHIRTEETVQLPVSLILTLKKGERTMEIAYDVTNTAQDHRLRLVVASDLCSDRFQADIPFDIITHVDGTEHPHLNCKTHPNTSFASLTQDGKGVAVFTEGLHECEKLDGGRLAFTVVRSTGAIERTSDEQIISPQFLCPGNQCIRRFEGRLGLYMFSGNDAAEAKLPYKSAAFRNPLMPVFMPCDRKTFSGGRTAVQDTALEELFYRPDPYADVSLETGKSLIDVKGAHVQVTAFKLAEDGDGLVVRFLQYGEKDDTVTVNAKGNIYMSDMSETSSEFLGKDSVTLNVSSKKIVTLRIK